MVKKKALIIGILCMACVFLLNWQPAGAANKKDLNPGIKFINRIVAIGSLSDVFRNHPQEYKKIFIQFLDDSEKYYLLDAKGKPIPGYTPKDVGIFFGKRDAIKETDYALTAKNLAITMPILQKVKIGALLFNLAAQKGEAGKVLITEFNKDNLGLWGLIKADHQKASRLLTEYKQAIKGREMDGEVKLLDGLINMK